MIKQIKFDQESFNEIQELFTIQQQQRAGIIPRFEVSFEDFKRAMVCFGHIETIKHGKTFILDENKEFVIDILHKHLVFGTFNGEISTKGIALVGRYGCGKTTLLNGFISLCNYVIKKYELRYVPFSEISASNFVRNYSPDFFNAYTRGNLLIDELGREAKSVKNYGTESNPVIDLLFERHRMAQNVTHITSNMSFEDLCNDETGYGMMLGERMKELFNFVELKGGSMR